MAVTPRGRPSGAKTSSRTRRLVAVAVSIRSASAGVAEEVEVALRVGGGSLGEAGERRARSRERGKSPRKALVEPRVDRRRDVLDDPGLVGGVEPVAVLDRRHRLPPPGRRTPWCSTGTPRRAVADVVAGVAADRRPPAASRAAPLTSADRARSRVTDVMGTASHGRRTSTLHLLAWRTNVDSSKTPGTHHPPVRMKEAKHAVPDTTPSSPSSSTGLRARRPPCRRSSVPTSGSWRRCTTGSGPTPRASTRRGWTTSRRTATALPRAGRPTAARPAPTAPATESKPEPRQGRAQARAERRPRADCGPRPGPHVDPTPTPAPVAKPRPESKAAEPAKGTTNPVPKEQPPTAQADASDEPTYTVLRGAPARTAANMDGSLTVPDRDLGPLGAGQAAVGQPHGHQQPPRPGARRQGVVHPPDRLRAGQGAPGHPGDERRLRHRSTASPT